MENDSTFTLKALLKPLAKKPPKGAIIEANKLRHRACHCTGNTCSSFQGNCRKAARNLFIIYFFIQYTRSIIATNEQKFRCV